MATTAATEPRTMPAIAPPDNPLLSFLIKLFILTLYSKSIFSLAFDTTPGYN